jgi:hypothetical protein
LTGEKTASASPEIHLWIRAMGGLSDTLRAFRGRAVEWLSRGRRTPSSRVDPGLRREVVLFLRDWLPQPAQDAYREMISADPEGWHRDPHFGGGIVIRHALRGNGITEEALGIESLERIWPELLREAVLGGPAPARSREETG